MSTSTRLVKVAYLLILGGAVLLLSNPTPVRAQRFLMIFSPGMSQGIPRAPVIGGWLSAYTQATSMLAQAGNVSNMMVGVGGGGMQGMGGGMMGPNGGVGMGGGMMGMMGMGGGMSMMGMGGGMGNRGMGGGGGGFGGNMMGMGGMGMNGMGFGGGFAGKGMGGFNGKKAL